MGEQITLGKATEAKKSDRPWEPVENGEIYEAEVARVQKVIKKWKDDDGNDIEKYEFLFRITEEGDYEGHWITGETPLFFNDSDRCKLKNWLSEILGMELGVGYTLDFDELKRKPVRIRCVVKRKEREQPGPNGETHWINEWVSDVYRPKGKKYQTRDEFADEEPF